MVLDDLADRHRGEAVLVVSHGGAIVATMAVLAYAPGRSPHVANGATYELEGDSDGWREVRLP
jgi:broad specificity phosphatase PhoE